jgi:putative transposase
MPQKNTIKIYDSESYYHVYSRGGNKQPIFLEASDYGYFTYLLERYLSTSKVYKNKDGASYPTYSKAIRLESYCLMRNHFHLLLYVTTDGDKLKSFMSSLKTSYSMYFNLKYKRVGSVFESRYKAKRIDDQSYLSHIHRYIHMNPRHWKTYRYSSLSSLFSGQKDWLQPISIRDEFADIDRYMSYVEEYQDNKDELEVVKHYLANL